MSTEVKNLVKELELASAAYYETDKPIMSDEKYDALVEQLRKLSPKNRFFDKPGSVPSSGRETLPIPMASLKKIKPDSWLTWQYTNKSCVMSEKLDGISALWCTGSRKLYLRGDGETGQNVSFAVPYIQGLYSKLGHWTIRGELIAPVSEVSGTLARNWVNGILHQSNPSVADMKKIHFVAYQVLEPKSLTRSQQFAWLVNQGFETAWHLAVPSLTLELLSTAFKKRRAKSIYTCDGIVVGVDNIPSPPSVLEPDDAVAYKEVVDDQCAVTKVLEVEWQASKTGTWIPRLRLEPVVIGSATIQYCTGFNAKYIEENKLGSDSIIKLRRSGDVIPVVDTVVKATGPSMPLEGTWKWDESRTHAVLLDPSSNVTVIMKGLVHSVTTFGVEGFRGASAMTLCDGGVTTVAGILTAGKGKLQSLLGNVVGSKLFDSLNEKIRSASPETWIVAAPCWSKGFGSRKLTAVYETEPDIGKWGSLDKAVKGVSLDSIEEIQKMLPQYYAWRKSIQDILLASEASTSLPKPVQKPAKQEIGQVCVSGFRDAEFVEKLANKGYGVSDSVKKTTAALFVADTTKTSTKIETAKKYNIPIFGRNMLDSFFHSLK